MNTPVFARLLGSMTALLLASSALAQQSGSVSDFKLPTENETPRSQAQGPVTEGVAPPRSIGPTPTPTATRAPAPQPAVAATPSPSATATPTASPTPRPSATPTAAPTNAPANDVASSDSEEDVALEPAEETAAPAPAAASPTLGKAEPPPAATAQAAKPDSGGIAWWLWLVALLVVGVLGTAAGWFWRDRRTSEPAFEVPQIERPRVPDRTGPPAELPKVALSRREQEAPAPPASPAPPVAAEDDEEPQSPLRIALEPARLSLSLLNATLAYRILLTNEGETALHDISIDGDMISAHASLAPEEQLAGLSSKLENRHLVRRLGPRETKVVRGEFTLPLPKIRPIRRGDAALFVPLARLRIVAGEGQDAEVQVRTSVVGQRSLQPGGGLRPFRLDLGPRIYSELAQRAFA